MFRAADILVLNDTGETVCTCVDERYAHLIASLLSADVDRRGLNPTQLAALDAAEREFVARIKLFQDVF